MNINPFVGACVDSSNFIIVTEYCFKGSLQVSTSEDIVLIYTFVYIVHVRNNSFWDTG
jgi:hypothetical protein